MSTRQAGLSRLFHLSLRCQATALFASIRLRCIERLTRHCSMVLCSAYHFLLRAWAAFHSHDFALCQHVACSTTSEQRLPPTQISHISLPCLHTQDLEAHYALCVRHGIVWSSLNRSFCLNNWHCLIDLSFHSHIFTRSSHFYTSTMFSFSTSLLISCHSNCMISYQSSAWMIAWTWTHLPSQYINTAVRKGPFLIPSPNLPSNVHYKAKEKALCHFAACQMHYLLSSLDWLI